MRRVGFATAAGEAVEGFLLEPEGGGPAPAILYIHAHGGRYDIGAREVLDGREALHGPIGPALARAGFRVLAIDMPCFGGRAATQEGAAAKAALWYGRSLAGQMLGELASALDWLAGDPGTDPRADRGLRALHGRDARLLAGGGRAAAGGGGASLLLRGLRAAGGERGA